MSCILTNQAIVVKGADGKLYSVAPFQEYQIPSQLPQDVADKLIAQGCAIECPEEGSDPAVLECLEKLKALTETLTETVTEESNEQEALLTSINECFEKLKSITQSENDQTQDLLEALEDCLKDLKDLAKAIVTEINDEGDETQEELKKLCEKLEKLIDITDAQEDLDDTDDDLRPILPKSYDWTSGANSGTFLGYAKVNENGSFGSWEVVTGTAPPANAEVVCTPESITECVESQEWTYGIDNTGTIYNDVAGYRIKLSDGSFLTFSQDGSSGSWTPQLQELATNIQAAADAAGLLWFVDPRAVNNANPTDISGNYGGSPTGLPGAPSVPVAQALIDGGMVARYVNIQVCPGQPVPVSAERLTSTVYGDGEKILTTAGAILGPLKKFVLCRACGKAPIWYKEDGVTLAAPGEIPKCYVPCGTISLTDSPPDRETTFEVLSGCDNLNQTNTANFVDITRRYTISADGSLTLDYFIEDSSSPSSLIPYILTGEFVDCDTGEIIPDPIVPCTDFVLATLFACEGIDGKLRNREWHDTAPVEPLTAGTAEGRAFRLAHDFSLPTTTDTLVTSLVLNDTNNTASKLDVQVIEGYIKVDQDMLLRYAGTSEGYWAVELGKCGGDLELIAENGGFFPTREMVFKIPKGIHQIRIWNIDSAGSNSSATMGYSLNGGATWTNDNTPPNIEISSTQITETCKKVKVCKDTGNLFDLLTGATVNPADCYACPIQCSDCGGSSIPQTLTLED